MKLLYSYCSPRKCKQMLFVFRSFGLRISFLTCSEKNLVIGMLETWLYWPITRNLRSFISFLTFRMSWTAEYSVLYQNKCSILILGVCSTDCTKWTKIRTKVIIKTHENIQEKKSCHMLWTQSWATNSLSDMTDTRYYHWEW